MNLVIDASQFLSTLAASSLGAFAAAALGYRYALAKFRRERTFDKQLAWYEKATASLIGAANKLNWALAGELAKIPEVDQRRAWAEAHSALVGLRGLEAEAEMYASPSSYEALAEAVTDVSTLAELLWRIVDEIEKNLGPGAPRRLYEIAFKCLYHAASRLASDVREHLALPELPRDWRIYDEELRELHEELSTLKNQGVDFTSDEAAAGPTNLAGQPQSHPA